VNWFARIVASVFACLVLSACAPSVDLITAVPEEEANEALGALIRAGIGAEKVPGKEGMVGIRIPGDEVAQAAAVLKDQGLPRERFVGMGEVFRKEGLISSPMEERARYVFALSQELSATISRMDGVVLARVHVVLPERSPDGEELTQASAAVFVKYLPQARLDGLQAQVKRLVANSIPGLALERVSLIAAPTVATASTVANGAGGNKEGLIIALVVVGVVVLGGAGGGWFALKRRKAAA
jgi:type III secretion protein J